MDQSPSCECDGLPAGQVKITLRPTVSRPVRLGVRRPSGTRDQLLEIFFRQLRACYFVAPSLTRGRVCNLLLLPAQSRLGLPSLTRGPQLIKTFTVYYRSRRHIAVFITAHIPSQFSSVLALKSCLPKIHFNSVQFLIIYVPSQQPQGQLQT
jgi:hypothetical protein